MNTYYTAISAMPSGQFYIGTTAIILLSKPKSEHETIAKSLGLH